MPLWAVYDNLDVNISSVVINFGDGNALKTMVPGDQTVQATFNSPGDKTISYTIIYSDGVEQTISSIVTVANATAPTGYPKNDEISKIDLWPITATIQFRGYEPNDGYIMGKGDAYVHYARGREQVRKPIIILDGFDPTDSRKVEEIYRRRLTYNNGSALLGHELRETGSNNEYDVIILNFPIYSTSQAVVESCSKPYLCTYVDVPKEIDGGSDYIERNAFVLVELLQRVNAQLQANNPGEKVILIGPSMGGLISRYALTYMEEHGMNHNCKLWISFDSPHRGANIPIGAQLQLESLSKNSEEAKNGYAQLDSPAARQMLIHHASAHIPDQQEDPMGAPRYRAGFLQTIDTQNDNGGFPKNPCLRKVALVNGSKSGQVQGYTTCSEALRFRARLSNVGTGLCTFVSALGGPFGVIPLFSCVVGRDRILNSQSYTSPSVGSRCKVLQQEWTGFGIGTKEKYVNGPQLSRASLDLQPGGYYDVLGEIASSARGGTWYGLGKIDAVSSFERPSFIPTVSAYALKNVNRNWADPLTNVNVQTETPFDAIYAPDQNQRHTELTPEAVTFIREQITRANQQQCNTPPPTQTSCSLAANACYTIQVQHTSQQLQAMADGTIKQQGANNQANQIWKIESRANGRVSFATQDGTNRSIQAANNANFGDELALAGYNGNGLQDWTVQCNPADNTLWRVVYPNNGNNTWDLKDFGNQPQLQIWGNTSEPFYAYRSFRFNPATCPTGTPPPPPTGGAFAVQNPQYNCQTGQLVMQTSGGDGSTIDYQISGLRGWGTDPNFTVPSWQLQGTAFTLQARQSGNVQMLSYTSSCNGGGTPPPPPPPPTGGAFAITEPTFACASGDLTINTSGGNGSAIEYQISGIRGWGSGATMNVPSWQRNGVAFTLQARQSGTEAPSRTFTASCGGGRLASLIEETVRLSVSPNPSRGVVRVRYWLAARQAGQLRVMSATGAVLSEQTVVGTGQTEETTLNLDAHPAGLYLINLSSSTVHETAKVLLQR